MLGLGGGIEARPEYWVGFLALWAFVRVATVGTGCAFLSICVVGKTVALRDDVAVLCLKG